MDAVDWVGTFVLLVGVFIRMATWRKYVNAYAAAHGSAPSRSWLISRDSNPTVERARLPLALGSLLALAGFGIFLFGLLSD